ncbi:zinc ribbon domain-containing protein [Kineococcus gynurae]|uniref:Zinc ribbon domain-containing protein n=1 Tax=Kineococcus gynurae TaxID=452979 RepID=A0ABV5LQA8_9ACTN
MPKAPAIDQQKLLDLQAVDTRLAQLAHRRTSLPEQKELEALLTRHRVASDELVAAQTRSSDLERLVARAEAAVQQVRERAARDTARLNSGAGSAKDLQSLQHELETLGRRQSVLEDEELEVMERLEQAQRETVAAQAVVDEVAGSAADVQARRDAALEEIQREENGTLARRQAASMGVSPDLVALYERVRAPRGGVGAALLRARRCSGCQLELNSADLAGIRAAAPDDVVMCEECGRILVRTAESGL